MSEESPKDAATDVVEVLAKCYNFKSQRITELDAYHCKNFAVEVVPISQNCRATGSGEADHQPDVNVKVQDQRETDHKESESCAPACENGIKSSQKLVLKILDSSYGTPEELPKARQQVMCSQFLRQRGFHCPRVVHAKNGELFGRTSSQCCTLLMMKLEGRQLGADHSRISSRVLFEVGALLAYLHRALQEGDPQYLDTDPCNPWALENIHLLQDYLHCIQDEDERQMLQKIITRFHHIRLEKFPKLNKGIIHGDFHDYNLIVDWDLWDSKPSPPPPPPSTPHHTTSDTASPQRDHTDILHKYGIIDFEEMSVSYPALELSRLIADMMIDCHQVPLLDIGGHVIAGYIGVDRTPVEQFGSCLYDAALACLAQYIVLKVYEFQNLEEPNNYILLGVEESRTVLGRLKTVDQADVFSAWGKVLMGHGFDNPFKD